MKTTFVFSQYQQSIFGWLKILAMLLIIMLAVVQCKNRTGGDGKEPSTGEDSSQHLYRLKLLTSDYDSLKAYGGDGLVLQFFYPASNNCSSPTLYAYTMKTGHQSVGKPPKQLQYDSITTEPFRGRSQVLGDQSIRFDSLDNVLSLVPGGYANKNYYLLFTPKFYAGNPHVYYEIQVSGSGLTPTRPTKSDPSPPYSAF